MFWRQLSGRTGRAGMGLRRLHLIAAVSWPLSAGPTPPEEVILTAVTG